MKTKRELYYHETRHLERFRLTAVAVFAVLAAILIKATLLGEFNWLGGG